MAGKPGWSIFVMRWMFVSAVGVLLGWFFAMTVGFMLAHLFPVFLSMVISGAVIGGIIGAGQWLVLDRSYGAWPAQGWVIVSTLGGIAGALVDVILNLLAPYGFGWYAFTGLFIGGGVGLGQWVILRRGFRGTIWWILISGLAWAISGWVMVLPLSFISTLGMLQGILFYGVIRGLLYGLSTGVLLAWFTRTAPHDEVRPVTTRWLAWPLIILVAAGLLLPLTYRIRTVQSLRRSPVPQSTITLLSDPSTISDLRLQVNKVLLETTVLSATAAAVHSDPCREPAAATAVMAQLGNTRATVEALRPSADAANVPLVILTVQPTQAAEATLVAQAQEAAASIYNMMIICTPTPPPP